MDEIPIDPRLLAWQAPSAENPYIGEAAGNIVPSSYQPSPLPTIPEANPGREAKANDPRQEGRSKVTKSRTRRTRKPAPPPQDARIAPRHVVATAMKRWGEKQQGPEYDGTIIPATRPDPIKPAACVQREAKGIFEPYECPICHAGFERCHGVYTHFGACVRRNGNPLGWKWNDDPSCEGYKGRSQQGLWNTDRKAYHEEKERKEEEKKRMEAENKADDSGKSTERVEEDE
ncbi:MAG: hypothetical protein Q9187_004599 [Circinaria calcarea]